MCRKGRMVSQRAVETHQSQLFGALISSFLRMERMGADPMRSLRYVASSGRFDYSNEFKTDVCLAAHS
jgi:hypothetical protein